MADGDAEPIAPEEVDAQRVCKTVTVKALGKTPFWFRWQASVSTADVFDKFGTRHSYDWEYSDWNLVRNPQQPSQNSATPSTVVLTSAINDNTSLLKDEKQFVYTMCPRGSKI